MIIINLPFYPYMLIHNCLLYKINYILIQIKLPIKSHINIDTRVL